MNLLESIFKMKIPAIGVVHLNPLPGAPLYKDESVKKISKNAIEEALCMVDNGINGLIIENFGDKMFKKKVGPETVASLTYITTKIMEKVNVPIGICVLQSDVIAGIAIGKAIGAAFIRAPYYTETYIVDAGLIDGSAADALRYRKYLGADIKIFADVHIKHGYSLSRRPIEESAEDTYHRGLADALVVTGKKTGGETNVEDIISVRKTLPDIPIIAGSGVSYENLDRYIPYINGIIVSTSLRVDGKVEEKLDQKNIEKFMSKLGKLRGQVK